MQASAKPPAASRGRTLPISLDTVSESLLTKLATKPTRHSAGLPVASAHAAQTAPASPEPHTLPCTNPQNTRVWLAGLVALLHKGMLCEQEHISRSCRQAASHAQGAAGAACAKHPSRLGCMTSPFPGDASQSKLMRGHQACATVWHHPTLIDQRLIEGNVCVAGSAPASAARTWPPRCPPSASAPASPW